VLGLGLGRAILFLRQHDATPYRDIILHDCTHWTGYDRQVEAPRTTYLLEVLDATGQAESYVEPILAALRSATDYRDTQQLVELALALARDGSDAAQAALYERFDRNDAEEPFAWASDLIELDGLAGFLYVAERIGVAVLHDSDGPDRDDWLLTNIRDEAEERCGKEAVRRALKRAACERPGTRAYVQAVDAIEAENGRRGSRRAAGVHLLVSNFEPDDEPVLIDLLETPRHADEHHWIGTGALDVLKAHPSADAVPVLFALYEHGRCTYYRKEAVESLRQLGELPDWLLEECRYVASESLREAADAWARGEEPSDD